MIAALILTALLTGCVTTPGANADDALFDYDANAPLDVVEHGRIHNDGYTLIELEYTSPDGGTVPALLYVPDTPATTPAPAIIIQHGLPGTRRSLSRLSAAHARAGTYVLAISAPWTRPSADRPAALIPTPLFDERDRAEFIQLIRDLRRGVDYLEQHPDIADDRIGFVGHSAGGFAGGVLAGVEPRIAAFVLMAPSPGWVSTVRHLRETQPDHFMLEPFDALSAEEQAAWIATLEPLEATHWIGRATSPILFQGGTQDTNVPRDDLLRLFAAASEPRRLEWYDLPHALGPPAFRDHAAFLARHLGSDATRFVPPARM